MSLKSDLSEDRRIKLQEVSEMPKKIYDQLVEPTFRRLHEEFPLEKQLMVRIQTLGNSFRVCSTEPEMEHEPGRPLPWLNYSGKGNTWKILKELCKIAEELELKATTENNMLATATFELVLDD